MKLKELRKNHNLTLEQFANIIGVTNQTISNWENENTEPDIKSLIKISDFFNISIDYLLNREIKTDIADVKKELSKMPKDKLLDIINKQIDLLLLIERK